MTRTISLVLILCFYSINISAQGCCSGSSGNPIAGGISTGVLQKNQIEFSTNYQYTFSDKFFSGTRDTINLFENLNSDYLFFKSEYGLDTRVTLSVAVGYFLNKSQVKNDSINNIKNGFSDIIFLPRYTIYNKDLPFSRTEITIGLGLKLPLGSHKDSSLTIVNSNIWDIDPAVTQLSSGSNDIILFSLLYRKLKIKNISLFASLLHIKKGYNSIGQKIGNYTSFSSFVSKGFKNKIVSTVQLKFEDIKKMDAGDINIFWNKYELERSSGSKKIFLIPQLSYSLNNFSFFCSYEIPLYQNIYGTQIGSKEKITFGLSYRFLTKQEISLD